MQKYLKNNNKGFTLVEVIVVAVIVLILAAVAIPLYNGYIRDSRVNTASNVAGSLASAFGAAAQANISVTSTSPVPGGATGNVVSMGTGDRLNEIRIPAGFVADWTDADGVRVCWVGTETGAAVTATSPCSDRYMYTMVPAMM